MTHPARLEFHMMQTKVSNETVQAEAAQETEYSAGSDASCRHDALGKVLAVGLIVIGVLSIGIARAANRSGWIPHRQDTTVYFGRTDWAVGAERKCIALPETDGAMIFLGCVNGAMPEFSPEVWPVTYWGQTRRPDMFEYVHADPGMHTWQWRCRRERNSLTCWAVN